MGVNYGAKLIYGLPSEEVPELLDDSEGDYAFWKHEFNYVRPWYDSPNDLWIIGIVIEHSSDYSPKCLNLEELPAKLEEAKKKFFEVTGKEGKLYLSPHGS